jgi:FtsH-binding integral membrane protein
MSNSEEKMPVDTDRARSRVMSKTWAALWLQIVVAVGAAYIIRAGQADRTTWVMLFFAVVSSTAIALFIRHLHNSARQHITSTYETLLRTIDSSKPKTKARTATTTAIDAVAHRIHGNRTSASIVLAGALFLVLALNLRWNQVAPQGLVIMLIAAIVILNASTLALDYRVSHGLFGTNEHEAREIVRYVLKNAGDSDFSGGLGARELDLSVTTATTLGGVWSGVPAYE